MKNLKDLTRPNIWSLTPYSSAREEYKGEGKVTFLDANEKQSARLKKCPPLPFS